MKKILLLTGLIVAMTTVVQARNVGINSDQSLPDPSAMLDVKSNNKGLLMPRLAKSERIAILNPANGLMVYQTDDTTGFWFYNSTKWTRLQDNLGNHSMSQNLRTNGKNISFNGDSTGIKVTDSGTVRIYGLASCCGLGLKERFKFEKDGSFFAGGELGVGASPMEGKGYRTSWYTYKGAFRSGYADNEWDDVNTGFFSWAGGSNSTASGLYAFAFGDANFATSTSSIVFGSGNKVYGAAGFAAGAGNEVNDTYGLAFGNKAKSRNLASAAIGYNLVAKGFASTVVGMYNDSLLITEDQQTSTTTPLFIVGSGSNTVRSNAMVVRKNGDVEVENLRVGGGNAMSKQQTGTYTVGSNTSKTKIVTFSFPASFSSAPKIVATPRNQAGTDYPDAFIVSVRSISPSQVTFNIIRIDSTLGWDQLLQIDWMAWE